jgi:adenylate kinase
MRKTWSVGSAADASAQVEGVCDTCGGELYQRVDDSEATVRNRLEVYRNQTEPLIDYYDRAGVVARVDGAKAPGEVYEDIRMALGPADV